MTMGKAPAIVPLTLPFAAGVALVEFAPLPPMMLQASLLVCSGLMGLALLKARTGKILPPALFFASGMLCAALDSLAGTGITLPGFITHSLQATCRLINSIPFAHDGTAALLQALLTGNREALQPGITAVFRSSGASHLLALSGMHLGIIYLLLGKVLMVLGRGRAGFAMQSIITVCACSFYAVMTGASPSIIRALIFIILNEWLKHSPQRKRDPAAIWCTALMVQLMLSPAAIKSAGFQLSYLAMLGIFTLYPRLDAFYPEGKGPVRWMWKSMALSVSCQVLTGPLAWLKFGTFPKYFLLTNLIAIPLTTILMFCAVGCLLFYAFGICPGWMVWLTDYAAELLQRSLSIISYM